MSPFIRLRRRRRLLLLAAAVLALLVAVPSAGAVKKARSLGPTPIENDCFVYRGNNPCYYGLWSGRFDADKHVLHVGDVLTTTIQTYGGFFPYYFWASPGGPGLKDLGTNAKNRCPQFAPPGPSDGSPNYFTLTCSFKAVSKTSGWVVFGPTMGLASSQYDDGDYYAITAGASVTGRVVNGKGVPVGGVRINISGPEDVYAVTDPAGFYDAVELTPGTYTVSIGKAKFCVDTGVAISKKTCKKSVTKKTSGNLEVNFKGLGDYGIFGVVRDEFKRGLGGVQLIASGLPGGESVTLTTALDGSYRLGLEDAATVSLASVKGGLPNAFYYVVKNGKTSTGTAADITPNASTPNVKVDWELDKRLQFNLPGNATRTTADGFSNRMWVIGVTTQHGDAVPNEAIAIEPHSTSQPAVVCSTDDKPLWPTLFGDGTIDTIGGFTLRTDANGRIPLQIFAGTVPGALYITVSRAKDRSQTATGGLALDGASGTGLASGLKAREAVISGGASAVGLAPSIETIVEWWAASRAGAGSFHKADLDIMPVRSGGARGLAIFPRNLGPTVDPVTGIVGPSDKTYVLVGADFRRLLGMGPLPLIGDWAGGSPVTIDRVDPRTYAGWPIPARFGPGAGTCLDGATGGTSLHTVHSPVNLQLTDASGKALGIAANGKPVATTKDGVVYRNGEAVAIITGPGAYRATLVGTGNGPVTIESDTPRGTTAVQFTAKKRKKATVAIANGAPIGRLRYNAKTVKPFAGAPLKIVGLPRSYRRLLGSTPIDPAKAAVTDLNGTPVKEAWIEVKAASGETITLAADRTGHLHGYWPSLKKGTRTFVVRAPGYTTTRVKVRVR